MLHKMEIQTGRVTEQNGLTRLQITPTNQGYSNAQLDDYSGRSRSAYLWHRGIYLTLQARFSHPAGQLVGTAGFGFWNAPFGDPAVPYPALPQAVWFFYGSPANNLPLAPLEAAGECQPGRGWFANTLDATTGRAWAMAPFALPVVLGNQWRTFRQKVWPAVQHGLGISYQPLTTDLTQWHKYELWWEKKGCRFAIDGQLVLQTPHSPRGPLGFVCWVDNQFMVVTPTGRGQAGLEQVNQTQWLEVNHFSLTKSGA